MICMKCACAAASWARARRVLGEEQSLPALPAEPGMCVCMAHSSLSIYECLCMYVCIYVQMYFAQSRRDQTVPKSRGMFFCGRRSVAGSSDTDALVGDLETGKKR